MVIEIAGVAAEVLCVHSQNEYFLRDYLSDRPPAFTIRPSQDDLARIRVELDRMAVNRGDRPLPKYDEAYLENNAIHALLAERLIDYDVLLIHGSALCMDGRAYVFTAKSGVGKSTHARLWREAFGDRVWMINDDKPMLRLENGGVTVYGTPWNGKHHLSRNAGAPLKVIVCLERADVNSIRPMAAIDGFQLLMKHAYASQKPAVMAKILTLEQRILEHTSFYTLNCNMQPEAALVAWQGISQA